MKILAIGAHPDDIELYAGGVLLRLIAEGHEVRTVVCTSGELRGKEIREREQRKAWEFMGVKKGMFLYFSDGHLGHDNLLISRLDSIVKKFKPDVVFSHSDHDHHQDHIAVAKCVRSVNRTWQFNWITYCSYDLRNSFQPNFFVNVDDYYFKKRKLLSIFESQKDMWYFREDVSISRSLGTNVGKYAEPFRIEFGFWK